MMQLNILQHEYLGNPLSVYAGFLLILLLALLLKKYIARILTGIFYSLFKKVSSDYYAEKFHRLLSYPVQGIILTIAFYTAFVQLDQSLSRIIVWSNQLPAGKNGQEISRAIVTLMDVTDKLFFLFTFFYFTLLISRIISFIFMVWTEKAVLHKDKARQQMLPLLKDVLIVALWIMGFFIVLGAVFHVNIAALIAGLGVGGIAIAFAAKESLENLLASFMVMLDKPFMIGDWIKIDNIEGIIEKVGFRSSRIRSFDRSLIVIPNRKLIDSSLENFSERGTRREKFTLGAVYGISRSKLTQIMQEIKGVIKQAPQTTEEPLVYLDSFGDSAVNIIVIYYLKISPELDYPATKQDINLSIYEIMYRLGTGFAFPTQVQVQGNALNPED
ncbi:MAG TPA: mechanosensitive ion channel family protein [Edaphocola sp.]|nr:mechanosensitive ion channel family protein [Edaphocola sp.]